MSVLLVLGSGALRMTLPLALGVTTLVLTVIFSYIQTILHYPDGGGAYTVAKDNLGKYPSLLAGAALLTDYILTVSVSVSAGVRAVTSAIPELTDYRVIIALTAIALITWVNLRGVRESGTIFAIPTYAFVGGVMVTILIGLVRQAHLFGAPALPELTETVAPAGSLVGFAYIWLLLRAFAGGCTALTGIEAISNGVKAFEPPEAPNGVGKSTALKAVFGFLTPNDGEILLEGRSIINVPTHKRIELGLAYIPQQPGVFRWMSVQENLEVGAWTFRNDKARVKRKLEENYERFPILKTKRRQSTGELSGGQQRMVEIARTLMTDPKVILVDEPTAGLAKLLSAEVYQMLVDLRDREGLTVLLVDQEIRHALKISDYVYVLELGRNKYEGPAAEFTDLEQAFWVGG